MQIYHKSLVFPIEPFLPYLQHRIQRFCSNSCFPQSLECSVKREERTKADDPDTQPRLTQPFSLSYCPPFHHPTLSSSTFSKHLPEPTPARALGWPRLTEQTHSQSLVTLAGLSCNYYSEFLEWRLMVQV